MQAFAHGNINSMWIPTEHEVNLIIDFYQQYMQTNKILQAKNTTLPFGS